MVEKDRPRDEIEEEVSHNGEKEEERTQKERNIKVEKELLLQQRQVVFIKFVLSQLDRLRWEKLTNFIQSKLF